MNDLFNELTPDPDSISLEDDYTNSGFGNSRPSVDLDFRRMTSYAGAGFGRKSTGPEFFDFEP